MRRLWKPFIRMSCSTSQCCGREKLHFFSTAKYLYSPFNKRQILWIPMSSTGLGVFSIVRQNSNQLLIFPILYIGRTSQSLKGHASIELKVLINLLYTKLCIYLWTLQILPENFLYTDTPCSRKRRCNIVEISNMISSLIFCFIVGAVLAAEEDSRSAYIKTQENKRLHGYVVKKIDSTDEMSCSQACLRHSWCTSSNFKESSGNCELNKHEFSTTDDNTKLTDNPGTTFSMFLKVRKVLNFHCLNNKGVHVHTSIISAYKKN